MDNSFSLLHDGSDAPDDNDSAPTDASTLDHLVELSQQFQSSFSSSSGTTTPTQTVLMRSSSGTPTLSTTTASTTSTMTKPGVKRSLSMPLSRPKMFPFNNKWGRKPKPVSSSCSPLSAPQLSLDEQDSWEIKDAIDDVIVTTTDLVDDTHQHDTAAVANVDLQKSQNSLVSLDDVLQEQDEMRAMLDDASKDLRNLAMLETQHNASFRLSELTKRENDNENDTVEKKLLQTLTRSYGSLPSSTTGPTVGKRRALRSRSFDRDLDLRRNGGGETTPRRTKKLPSRSKSLSLVQQVSPPPNTGGGYNPYHDDPHAEHDENGSSVGVAPLGSEDEWWSAGPPRRSMQTNNKESTANPTIDSAKKNSKKNNSNNIERFSQSDSKLYHIGIIDDDEEEEEEDDACFVVNPRQTLVAPPPKRSEGRDLDQTLSQHDTVRQQRANETDSVTFYNDEEEYRRPPGPRDPCSLTKSHLQSRANALSDSVPLSSLPNTAQNDFSLEPTEHVDNTSLRKCFRRPDHPVESNQIHHTTSKKEYPRRDSHDDNNFQREIVWTCPGGDTEKNSATIIIPANAVDCLTNGKNNVPLDASAETSVEKTKKDIAHLSQEIELSTRMEASLASSKIISDPLALFSPNQPSSDALLPESTCDNHSLSKSKKKRVIKVRAGDNCNPEQIQLALRQATRKPVRPVNGSSVSKGESTPSCSSTSVLSSSSVDATPVTEDIDLNDTKSRLGRVRSKSRTNEDVDFNDSKSRLGRARNKSRITESTDLNDSKSQLRRLRSKSRTRFESSSSTLDQENRRKRSTSRVRQPSESALPTPSYPKTPVKSNGSHAMESPTQNGPSSAELKRRGRSPGLNRHKRDHIVSTSTIKMEEMAKAKASQEKSRSKSRTWRSSTTGPVKDVATTKQDEVIVTNTQPDVDMKQPGSRSKSQTARKSSLSNSVDSKSSPDLLSSPFNARQMMENICLSPLKAIGSAMRRASSKSDLHNNSSNVADGFLIFSPIPVHAPDSDNQNFEKSVESRKSLGERRRGTSVSSRRQSTNQSSKFEADSRGARITKTKANSSNGHRRVSSFSPRRHRELELVHELPCPPLITNINKQQSGSVSPASNADHANEDAQEISKHQENLVVEAGLNDTSCEHHNSNKDAVCSDKYDYSTNGDFVNPGGCSENKNDCVGVASIASRISEVGITASQLEHLARLGLEIVEKIH